MSTGPLAVLDACVLANFSLCDTLLRLAEAPPLYEPKVGGAYGGNGSHAGIRVGDAWVTGHGPFISRMANHENDRHVLAAAVSCGASIIVTS